MIVTSLGLCALGLVDYEVWLPDRKGLTKGDTLWTGHKVKTSGPLQHWLCLFTLVQCSSFALSFLRSHELYIQLISVLIHTFRYFKVLSVDQGYVYIMLHLHYCAADALLKNASCIIMLNHINRQATCCHLPLLIKFSPLCNTCVFLFLLTGPRSCHPHPSDQRWQVLRQPLWGECGHVHMKCPALLLLWKALFEPGSSAE